MNVHPFELSVHLGPSGSHGSVASWSASAPPTVEPGLVRATMLAAGVSETTGNEGADIPIGQAALFVEASAQSGAVLNTMRGTLLTSL